MINPIVPENLLPLLKAEAEYAGLQFVQQQWIRAMISGTWPPELVQAAFIHIVREKHRIEVELRCGIEILRRN